MKWALETIKNDPFETGISPIDRSHDSLQIREIPGSNAECSTHFRPHFIFVWIFRAIFLRFRRNRKKIVRKITSAGFFGRFFSVEKIARKINKKKWGLKRGNTDPFETGISRICRGDMGLQIPKSPVSNGSVLMVFRPHFFFDFSGDFLRFRRNRKKCSKNPFRSKWGLKMMNNAPFET